ncbi:hypothetical protein HF086_011213 [Spodoptera exigua]|uniref:Uncharacterized protein n=1 Tax=Spodoptera exigua TaxID=7107 RepID=A0A922SLW0_SPOEX|nr:hypothetical protein HF086_011213 [Spodoptera exigua]
MAQILEQQERIADTSLTLEMQRIAAEHDWEKVREQREAEMQDELRAMYKLREQEIISQLMQLENKQYDMEQENQSLREKLEEYQRKEREEAEKMAETISGAPEDTETADAEVEVTTREALQQRTPTHARGMYPPSPLFTARGAVGTTSPTHTPTCTHLHHYSPHAGGRRRMQRRPTHTDPRTGWTIIHRTREALEVARKRRLMHARHNKPDAHRPTHGVCTHLHHYSPHAGGTRGRAQAEAHACAAQQARRTPTHARGMYPPSPLFTARGRHSRSRASGGSCMRGTTSPTHTDPRTGYVPTFTIIHRTREALEVARKRRLMHARHNKPDAHRPTHGDEDGDSYMTSPDSPGAAGLNRSHSSPNIAKVSSDEEETCVPAFDRSTKPTKVAPSSDLHQRDFQPVWGDVVSNRDCVILK